MKILLAHNTYQQPGGEDVVFEQERRILEQHGNEVLVYQRSNHEINQFSRLQRLALIQRIVFCEESKQAIAEMIRKHKPEIVHVTNTFMMISPSIYEACLEANVPVVQTLQNYRLLCPAAVLYREGKICEECPDHGLHRSLLHGCYRHSRPMTAAVAFMLHTHRSRGTWKNAVTAYVVATEFAKRKFIEGGLPAEKIHVKPNFVDPDPGERESPGDYALFVGRLSPEKGVSTLIEAWMRLAHPMPLKIIGDGPLRAELEAQAKQSGGKHISFVGRLNRDMTRAAIKNAAFLVVPSVWYEGFPMVMTESLACGTPVVGSRLGAIEEVIDHYRTGLLFTPGNALELARCVDWACSHPRDFAAMGREARHDYETRYSAEKNYCLLMNIYDRAIHPGTKLLPV